MDDPALSANAIINAAAVWFIFKAIEVTVFMVYDIQFALVKWIRSRGNPDPDPRENKFERSRGWMEYVWSGVGFLNIDLLRQRKILLLLISTGIPLAVFVLELMSITLGNESRICKTSVDRNVVSSNSLVLFGNGRRHGNLSSTFEQAQLGTELSILRPCVSWSSTQSGVDFLSKICVDITNMIPVNIATVIGTNQQIGLLLPKPDGNLSLTETQGTAYLVFIASLQLNTSRIDNVVPLGFVPYLSDVVVGGKKLLYQETLTTDKISEEHKIQLMQDVRLLEQFDPLTSATYFEDETFLGFIYENATTYAKGAVAVVLSILAQATREPIKTAAEMSPLNILDDSDGGYEISCEEDFVLPRTASIIIIVVAVTFRLTLIFLPTSMRAVRYALERSRESRV